MVIKLSTSLQTFGFKQSYNDHSLLTYKSSSDFVDLLVHVDDILVAGTSPTLIGQVKAFLSAQFLIKDLGPLKYFLGIEVTRSKQGMYLN